jgi:hypothetical protein
LNPVEYLDSFQEEIVAAIEVDLSGRVQIPTITLTNKYGDVIAASYGEKSEI